MPFSPRVDDPLADETFPDPPSTCDYSGPGLPVGSSDPAYNIAPSVSGGSVKICGGLHIQNEVTLAPVPISFTTAAFRSNAGASLIGDEVAILLTGDSSSDVGSFDINGTATIELTAGDSTEFPGVVLGQSRDAPYSTSSSDTNRVNGGSSGFITGIVYVPNQPVEFSGNTSNTARASAASRSSPTW